MDEFKPYLKKLYHDDAERLYEELVAYKKTLPKIAIPSPNLFWYKFINLYFIYPDSRKSSKVSPIRNLAGHLEHVKNLGCNAVHVLPFLDSPMVDKGFDVRDYYKVRKDLGTFEDLQFFLAEAKKQGIRVFMDLVFNHVSDQHEWFRKAVAGDEEYRKYFICHKSKPRFKKKFHKDSAVWAKYVVNGRVRDINVAFPEYVGDIPHWREGKDGYWYYHTYYPQQIDVNWRNPDVFLEYAKILMYWASLGFNFRLDAMPFVGKSAYKEVDNTTTYTHDLSAALSALAEAINPESVIIVETYEKISTVIDYFGTSNHKEAKLSYNFHLCTYLWVSIIKRDVRYLWGKLNNLKEIPSYAEWMNFLRNHDELSLAYLSPELLKSIKKELNPHGKPFREGYGIAGRTYSLIGNNEKRFLNAYFLLASLPGGMLFPYGDEVGAKNVPQAQQQLKERKDSRNINRGPLTTRQLHSVKGKRIFAKLSETLHIRQVLREYLNVWPQQLHAPVAVFAASYKIGSSELVVLINLSHKTHRIQLETADFEPVIKQNVVHIDDHYVSLGSYAGVWLQK